MKELKLLLLFVVVLISSNQCRGTETPNLSSTTPTSMSTTTLSPVQECQKANSSCETCVKIAKCLWCNSRKDSKCLPYPVGQVIPHSDVCPLSQARWGICWVNYEALLITMGVIAGVLLISTCCCVYCCCCRKDKKKAQRKYQQEEDKREREAEDRRLKHDERRRERKGKLDEIRQKYGLVKDGGTANYSKFDNEA